MNTAFPVFIALLLVAMLSVVVARCEHVNDNQNGQVVISAETIGKVRSKYVVEEDSFLANRHAFYDTTGKFSVGDTVFFSSRP